MWPNLVRQKLIYIKLNSHLIIIQVYPPQGCLFLFFVSSSLLAWMMYRHFHNVISESDMFTTLTLICDSVDYVTNFKNA